MISQSRLVINVCLRKLSNICNPFNDLCWDDLVSPISYKEVELAIIENRIAEHSKIRDRKYHIERIANFVINPSPDPIGLDISTMWVCFDGNHRLAAAIYSKKSYIRAYILSGFENEWLYKE